VIVLFVIFNVLMEVLNNLVIVLVNVPTIGKENTVLIVLSLVMIIKQIKQIVKVAFVKTIGQDQLVKHVQTHVFMEDI